MLLSSPAPLWVRRGLAEGLGTAMLVMAVVGSGIAASRLSPTDTGLQLLENAIATGGALIALILMFVGVSGAHFNPVVTLVDRSLGAISNRDTVVHIAAQVAGACVGAIVANAMFGLAAFERSTTVRTGGPLWFSEVVATFGLLMVIFGTVRTGRSAATPYAVGLWITGAYWFTSSTSFANPAVTLGRTLSNSFAGIAPRSAPMFIAMQFIGAAIALAAIVVVFPQVTADS